MLWILHWPYALKSSGIGGHDPAFERVQLGRQAIQRVAVVRVALLGPAGPTGTFTRWENETIPW